MTTNTALQVTNFNFYGDDLIALRDNATGNIYAAINHILKGIGFTETQIEYQQRKLLHDELFKSHLVKFLGVDLNMPSINEIWCISNRKLPMALAKISITPKMKKEQPEMSEKLIRYQDKCADVLASVFIDGKVPNNIDISPLISSITSLSAQMITLTEEMTKLKESQNKPKPLPANKYSRWKTKVFEQMKSIQSYVNDNSDQELTLPHTMKLVFDELQDTYNIDLSEYTEMYKCEYGLDFDTKVQTLDVINHYKDIRDMFTLTVESIMDRLHITENTDTYSTRNIFDELAAQIDSAKIS